MTNKLFYKPYVFLDKINDIIKKNLLKFEDITIIVDIDKKELLENELSIIKFAKINKIPFFFKNNYQKCIKYNASGIFLDAKNTDIIRPIQFRKNFKIIGSAHNQREYFNKLKQKCKLVMLSPLFYNEKYSKNKILNIHRFNQITLNWKTDVCALGGINLDSLKKVRLTKARSVAFKKLISDLKIKKPAYNLM
jgi:thiamine-phosphate pyrophosphorylase